MTAVEFVRGVLATVLLAAAVAKLLSGSAARAKSIREYEIVPEQFASLVATVLVLAELAAALLLLSPLYRVGASVVAALGLGFAGAVSSALAAGRRPGCGCFGRGLPVSPVLLAVDLLLMGTGLSVAVGLRSTLGIATLSGSLLVVGLALQAARLGIARVAGRASRLS